MKHGNLSTLYHVSTQIATVRVCNKINVPAKLVTLRHIKVHVIKDTTCNSILEKSSISQKENLNGLQYYSIAKNLMLVPDNHRTDKFVKIFLPERFALQTSRVIHTRLLNGIIGQDQSSQIKNA